MECKLCGALTAVHVVVQAIHGMWCELCGPTYVMQPMRCTLCGASHVVQPTSCKLARVVPRRRPRAHTT
eukprot:139298-Pyramimonas_sp.AAC.1